MELFRYRGFEGMSVSGYESVGCPKAGDCHMEDCKIWRIKIVLKQIESQL